MVDSNFDVVLAAPRGFCAGVERAIETVNLSLAKFGAPVYVLHEIVHNKHVLMELEELGAVFVEQLADIPTGEICIFSAHGVSLQIERQARKLGLRTIDATCPLVGSVHRMVEKYHSLGFDVIIIGHHKHPEVEGTAGRVSGGRVHIVADAEEAATISVKDNSKTAYVTQTTLSRYDVVDIIDVLKDRFPNIRGPKSNICFATQNRQDAARSLVEKADILFVVGSKNSSNSNRLKEVAIKYGVEAHLIDDYHDIDPQWLLQKKIVGITAGASAPERLVADVIRWLKEHGAATVTSMEGIKEKIHFKPAT